MYVVRRGHTPLDEVSAAGGVGDWRFCAGGGGGGGGIEGVCVCVGIRGDGTNTRVGGGVWWRASLNGGLGVVRGERGSAGQG